MGEIIGLLILAVMAVAFTVCIIIVSVKKGGGNTNRSSCTTRRTMRCPNCGSTATVHGNSWECGWCGDFGSLR